MRTPRRTATVALAVAGLTLSGLSSIGAAAAAPATASAAASASVQTSAPATVSANPDRQGPPNMDLKATEKLRQSVTLNAVMAHLQEFQKIADANGGNRAAGTPGYEASAAYVERQLRSAGYTPTRQKFTFHFEQANSTSLEQTAPQQRTLEHVPMSYSPATAAGGVTGDLVAPGNALGCEAGDWAGVQATGKIALVQRGVCPFSQKSAAAKSAGAAAVIIYNNADGTLNGTLGAVSDANAPTTGITQALGQELVAAMAQGPVTVKFVLDKTMEQRETFNVIAETREGSADNVVVVGAHLDGAPEGPGINDNGSGSAAILEVAKQINQQRNIQGKPANKVRFIWWGAEELGLLGSEHYVEDLKANNPEGLKKIATYLNFDMVGSPNHIIGVYDADQSTHQAPVEVPPGSIETEQVFTDYFDEIKQPWVDTEFSGRSDYQAFIANGVPASGLFTGADGTKTEAEQQLFGGTAGQNYNQNYHTPADDLNNINKDALEINSKAIAHATLTLAISTKAVNGKN